MTHLIHGVCVDDYGDLVMEIFGQIVWPENQPLLKFQSAQDIHDKRYMANYWDKKRRSSEMRRKFGKESTMGVRQGPDAAGQ